MDLVDAYKTGSKIYAMLYRQEVKWLTDKCHKNFRGEYINSRDMPPVARIYSNLSHLTWMEAIPLMRAWRDVYNSKRITETGDDKDHRFTTAGGDWGYSGNLIWSK